jgi:hypothetical protein
VQDNWYQESSNEPSCYSPSEKTLVTSNLVKIIVSQKDLPIISTLCQSFRFIFKLDYPTYFSNIENEIQAILATNDPHQIYVICLIFREITKVYEYKDDDALSPMIMFVNKLFPFFQSLVNHLVVNFDNTESGSILHQVLKSYYTVINLRLVKYEALANTNSISFWSSKCLEIIVKPIPILSTSLISQVESDDNEEEIQGMAWCKAKKWALKILCRFIDRYADMTTKKNDSMHQVSTLLMQGVLPKVSETCIHLLSVWEKEKRYLPKVILFYLIRILSEAVNFSSCWKVIKPSIEYLLTSVCVQIFLLSTNDLELMMEDPIEYTKNQADPFISFSSPVNSAENLFSACFDKRKSSTFPVVEAFLAKSLRHFSSPQTRNPLILEALLHMLECNGSYVKESKKKHAQIEQILLHFVAPGFQANEAYLRARCCSVWAAYSDIRFTHPASSIGPASLAVFQALQDKGSKYVRFTAANVLKVLMEHNEVARTTLQPYLVNILEVLFTMLDEVGLDEVVETVHTIIDVYSQQMPSLAGPMTTKLIAIFHQLISSKQTKSPSGSPRTEDEEDAALDDETALAAEGILASTQTMIAALVDEEKTTLVLDVIAPLIWDLLDQLFVTSGPCLEFLDQALSMYGQLCEVAEDKICTSPKVWTVFQKMMITYKEAGSDYLDELMYPLDCIVSYGGPVLCNPNAPFLQTLLSSIEWTNAHLEEESQATFSRIIVSMLHHCRGMLDHMVEKIILLYLQTFEKARTNKLKANCCTIIFACLIYNAPLVVSLTNKPVSTQQPASGPSTLFEQILFLLMKEDHLLMIKKSMDCKLAIFGCTALLSLPEVSSPQSKYYSACVPRLLQSIILLQVRYEELLVKEAKRREKAKMDDDYDEDGGDGANDEEIMSTGGEDDADEDEDENQDEETEESKDFVDSKWASRLASDEHAADADDDDNDDDDDSEYTSSDPPNEATPIDHIDHYVFLSQTLLPLQGTFADPSNGILRVLQGETVAKLEQLVREGMKRKMEGKTATFGPSPN